MSSREFFQKKINEFVFTTLQGVFVYFLEEIEDTKKTLSKLPHLYKAFVLSIVQIFTAVKDVITLNFNWYLKQEEYCK